VYFVLSPIDRDPTIDRVDWWSDHVNSGVDFASMTDFSIKNLKEADDSAADRGGDIEARFGRKHLDSEHLGVSYFRYGPGYRSPFGHRHREQEEAYVVVSGSGRMKLDDHVVDVQQWDVIRVAPNVARAIEGGANGLELIAIGSDRPEGGDGEMVKDFWQD
jgi:mannose-6-phosphate isomerase-like protein (cupin superfamily)